MDARKLAGRKPAYTACGDAGGDLGAEAAGQHVLEHPSGTGGGKLVGTQQAEQIAHQPHHGRKEALARIAHHQDHPYYSAYNIKKK